MFAINKSNLIVWSDRFRLQRIVSGSPEHQITSILYHNFFFDGETRDQGRDRLKTQCEWIRNSYEPISAKNALNFLQHDTNISHPLLVTIDDAKIELLEVIEIFDEFEIPITLFVCVGWTDLASPTDEGSALSRVIAKLHLYDGSDFQFRHNHHDFTVTRGDNRDAIDRLIENAELQDASLVEALDDRIDEFRPKVAPQACNWSEIRKLKANGVAIGSHSISHPRLGLYSPKRVTYEITASRYVLLQKIGTCDLFAYPYGEADSFSDHSTLALRKAGYKLGFLTTPAFASINSNTFTLPRIVLPDKAMPLIEFIARVRGGGIPLTALKKLIVN